MAGTTTWRTDDRPGIPALRQCTWWARIIVPRLYASSVVFLVGAGLTVRADDVPADADRDFDVLAATGISVASAGIGIAVVALALPFRRSQTARSRIEHHIGLLERGIRPSMDAVSELCSLLSVGLGSAGMFAIPIVQPAMCRRAMYLYGCTDEPRDLLPLLEEARTRLAWVRPPEPTRRLAPSTLRALDDELRELPPRRRPGPVQLVTFGILLELPRRPYADVLPVITPTWQLACRAELPADRDRCRRQVAALPGLLRV